MKINWQEIAKLITMLSHIAMQWYSLLANEPNDAAKARKAAARVIDPDTPEQNVEEVVL